MRKLEDETGSALVGVFFGHVLAGKVTCPESGISSPAMTRSSVVLPLPLGPSSATSSPVSTSSETSCKAGNFSKLFEICVDGDAHESQ